MRLEFEKRKEPSRLIAALSPVVAVLATLILGAGVFTLLGYDGVAAMEAIFFRPLTDSRQWEDLANKATPLILIASGLAVGFRANVWNIGAEGQYIAGGLAATGVALLTAEVEGGWILPLMCLAGAAGGAAYASVPALLRTKLDVNEILTSLMLSYAAIQLLNYLVKGPWQDPDGFGQLQTALFTDSQTLPTLWEFGVVFWSAPIAIVLALVMWLIMSRTVFGFRIRVIGAAPKAAIYGGFGAPQTIWYCMLLSGALAGLAGAFEAAGPFGQMAQQFPAGYGFTAIIVAFLGRLHPLGVVLAGLVLAVTTLGGEVAQKDLSMPAAAAGVAQAMMLFLLLATDLLAHRRLRIRWAAGSEATR